MKRKYVIPVFVMLLLIVSFLVNSSFSPSVPAGHGQELSTGPLSVWTFCEGQIEARRMEPVIAQFNGSATIIDLASEGSIVKKGDRLVRFDAAQLELDLPNLERDYTLAKSELESLDFAQIPLEVKDLELQVLEAQFNYDAEKKYLRDNVELKKEDLVSEQEVEQQKLKVAQVKAKLEQLKTKKELTIQYLHPSQLERARAKLESAKQELELARQQVANRTVLAPTDGLVVYWPLHVGGDFRTVRVGDTLYRNQSFMAIPDMSDLVVNCQIPESELSRVGVGHAVVIIPLAYPDMPLRGHIETVGSTAQMVPGRQQWQKYFRLTVALDERNDRLRTGMSVNVQILTYQNDTALLVPRAAVWWEDGAPYCRVRNGRRTDLRKLVLGMANATHYEVQQGLASGEFVLTP